MLHYSFFFYLFYLLTPTLLKPVLLKSTKNKVLNPVLENKIKRKQQIHYSALVASIDCSRESTFSPRLASPANLADDAVLTLLSVIGGAAATVAESESSHFLVIALLESNLHTLHFGIFFFFYEVVCM